MSEPFVAQLGRISGKLLSDNLLRNGVDLTFRNAPTDADLLYLDVNTGKVGINTTPTTELDINGTSNLQGNLIISDATARFGNIIFQTDGTVTTGVGPIIFDLPPGNARITMGTFLTSDFKVKDNYIQATNLDSDINLYANGTGIVDIQSTANISNDVYLDGSISTPVNMTVYGQFIIGNDPLDTVVIEPNFSQDVVPLGTGLFDLGSASFRWANAYINDAPDLLPGNITTSEIIVSDQININSNGISTIQSNDPLIVTSGSGSVNLESITINNNNIINNSGSSLTLSSTGIGYVEITGTNAFTIPVGTTAERSFGEVGETRWNTDLGYLECFDGTTYQVATGGGVVVTAEIMQEFADIYALILG